MARFQVLKNFEKSVMRKISRISHDWSAAEFAEHVYWPGLAREMRRLEGKPLPDNSVQPDVPHFQSMKGLWEAAQPIEDAFHRGHLPQIRPKLYTYFPRRLEIADDDVPRLRFLSFNMIDYNRFWVTT